MVLDEDPVTDGRIFESDIFKVLAQEKRGYVQDKLRLYIWNRMKLCTNELRNSANDMEMLFAA